jgi:hypothetical protein
MNEYNMQHLSDIPIETRTASCVKGLDIRAIILRNQSLTKQNLSKAVKAILAESRCIFLLDIFVFVMIKLLNRWLGINLMQLF